MKTYLIITVCLLTLIVPFSITHAQVFNAGNSTLPQAQEAAAKKEAQQKQAQVVNTQPTQNTVTTKKYIPLIADFNNVIPNGGKEGDFAGFFNYLLKTVIGLAGILAVLMIVIGGIQYVSTDSWSGKDSGKKRIQAALGGLLLALSSYLILNTIDPTLTYLNFASTLKVGQDNAENNGTATGGGNWEVVGNASTTPGANTSGSSGGSINGIPYGGAFNKTLQDWQVKNGLTADGKETINTLKDFNGESYICGNGSTFGGPNDTGVSATETGAVSGEILRQLDTQTLYIAGRWDYNAMKVASTRFVVMNPRTGAKVYNVRPVDWGPHPRTGRSWDVSPGVMSAIGSGTDQELCVRVN